MTDRSCKRIPSSFVVKFIDEGVVCYGIATNVSEKGMCIQSGICMPCDSKFNVMIPLKDEHLEVPVEVRWIKKTYDFYDVMGVELMQPPEKFLKLVTSCKMSFETV